MKKTFFQILKHPLISGSSIIFIGSFGANILNYIFNLAMGRLLSVSDYGLLISLSALVTLLTLLQISLSTLFTKFSSQYFAKKDSAALSSLVWTGTKITLFIGALMTLALILMLQPISAFLHVNNVLLMSIMFLTVIISILYSLPAGVLQGGLKFMFVSILGIGGALTKVLLGIGLVSLGWGVIGGGIAIFAAFMIPYVVSFLYVIKKYHIKTDKEAHVRFISEFKKISGPFLLASIAITILQGSDVIFARHFLTSTEAGQYAALSVMGKAIFYVTAPIYFVFFPVIAHKKEKKENTTNTLLLALGVIFGCSLVFTFIYFLFPQLILGVFFPSPIYAILAKYLGPYSIYIMIFSFCFLLYNYFLSTGKVGVYKINWFVAIIFIISLFFYHSNIQEFINVLILSSLLLLFLLCIYYKMQKA